MPCPTIVWRAVAVPIAGLGRLNPQKTASPAVIALAYALLCILGGSYTLRVWAHILIHYGFKPKCRVQKSFYVTKKRCQKIPIAF